MSEDEFRVELIKQLTRIADALEAAVEGEGADNNLYRMEASLNDISEQLQALAGKGDE